MTLNSFEQLLIDCGTWDSTELRRIFSRACIERYDMGTGWDPAPEGQMTFFGFVESLLMLASKFDGVEADRSKNGGMEDAVKTIVERAWARNKVAVTSSSERGWASKSS